MLHLNQVTLAQDGFAVSANWQLPPGGRLALLGPSGAGKSTVLMGIAGFIAPTAGQILWQGKDLAALSPAQRPVSILFQDQNVFPHLTLAQNLGLAINPRMRLTAGDITRVDAVLDRLGLSGFGPRKPATLSGGQLARAALGRVLLQERPLLLLDEPFAALGPALKADLLGLVAELAVENGTTVVLVTHEPADARRFAGLVTLVHDGVAEDPVATDEIFANPPPALRAYLG